MDVRFAKQVQFVEKLKLATPTNQKLVDVLSDLLEVSNDSAYRRLRCETAISMDEYVKICEHFRIPLDISGPETTSQAVFHFTLLSEEENNTEEYLKNVLGSLQAIHQSKGKIFYATEDIPLFYYFMFPELTEFKLFFWKKSILDDARFQEKNFMPGLVKKELVETCRKIFEIYCQINCIEVYPEDTFTSTLRQIEYYWESDMLESQFGVQLCDQLLETVQFLKSCAGKNSKSADQQPNLEMYLSDLMINTNTILVDMHTTQMVFKSVNTFNSISTSHRKFYEETKRWMDGLIRKSTMISGVSERHRNKLFKRATDQIMALKEKMNKR